MHIVDASESAVHIAGFLEDVEHGESLRITRNGNVFGRIDPAKEDTVKADPERAKRAMESIRALRERNSKVTLDEILSARDEGRG